MGTIAFDRNNTRKIGLKFNIRTDEDIIRKLDEVGNKQSYIKQLIRADIAAHGGGQQKKEDATCSAACSS